jgi:hypothetical protein
MSQMGNGYPVVVLAPVVGLAVYCVCHLLTARLWRPQTPYPALVASFFPGLLAVIGCTHAGLSTMHASTSDWVGYAILNLATYGALGWGYFHFVNLCIASLRIRILEEIVEQGGAVAVTHLRARYDDMHMLEKRLHRLVHGEHLACHDGRYYIANKAFLYVARFFELLRMIILGKTQTIPAVRDPAAATAPTHNTGRRGTP